MKELIINNCIKELSNAQNVSYVLNDSNLFSITGFKVLRSQSDEKFIKCSKVLYNGKIKLIYHTLEHKSLNNMLSIIDSDTLVTIISNLLLSIIDIKTNGFLDCNNLDLSTEKIYVDQNTLNVSLIYLPVSTDNYDFLHFENEFSTDLIKLISYSSLSGSEKMIRISSYLSNSTLNLDELYKIIVAENGEKKYSVIRNEVKPSDKNENLIFKSADTFSNVEFVIGNKEFIIGKNSDKVDGAITFNNAISRVHCKFIYQNMNYYITDLGSANGTYVNGKRINPQQPVLVNDGDRIRLANSDFIISIGG